MKKFLSILLVLAIMLAFSACGADGKDGQDGVTPTIEISEDGYWIINGVKTDHKAIGTDGKDGIDGTNGKDGKDGYTPTIDISADGYWVINGQKTNVRATPEEIVDENPQGLEFYLQDDGTYTVSIGNAKHLSHIVIPETYKGSAVAGIEKSGFIDCDSLKSVTIGDSVVSIDAKAFQSCDSLTTVTIGASVTTIGNVAFYNCGLLTTINFAGTVEQWNAITKVYAWNEGVPATYVQCSDGTVRIK